MERIVPPRIGIIGASECSRKGWEDAYRIGAGLAERGAVLVCGGLGGVMEAAAKGAYEAGGLTLGFLPGDRPETANPYIVIPIPTAMQHARNTLVVRASEVVIAVEGGYGTLSEIALSLNMGKPLIGLHTWPDIPGVRYVNDSREAVTLAFEHLPPSGV